MQTLSTPIYEQALLPAGSSAFDHAIVKEPSTITVVHPGQTVPLNAWRNPPSAA